MDTEKKEMAVELLKAHGQQVLELAAMMIMVQVMFDRDSRKGSDVGPMLAAHRACVQAYLREQSIRQDAVFEAVDAMEGAAAAHVWPALLLH